MGKGTYSTRMAKSFGMDHIAAGDLVRAEMKRGSELGKQVGKKGCRTSSLDYGPCTDSNQTSYRSPSHHLPLFNTDR